MSSLEDLIGRAKVLRSEGHSPGQIADELSLSMETVTWLLTQAKGAVAPKDVHIDWTAVSSSAPLLEQTAFMMLRRYYSDRNSQGVPARDAGVIVGIALSGIPLAAIIAVQEDAIWVIFDKRGFKDVEGVPVYSLFKISRID
jgi:orotate phosphoribosyltransferase